MWNHTDTKLIFKRTRLLPETGTELFVGSRYEGLSGTLDQINTFLDTKITEFSFGLSVNIGRILNREPEVSLDPCGF